VAHPVDRALLPEPAALDDGDAADGVGAHAMNLQTAQMVTMCQTLSTTIIDHGAH
jgi:hypothetical protein